MTETSLIFDLGGVVLDWNPRYLFEQRISDPALLDHFLTEVCSHGWNARLDLGEPAAKLVEQRCTEFPGWAPHIRAYLEQWPRMLGDPIPAVSELLDSPAGRGVPLYALTNWSAQTWPYAVERFPVWRVFRDILVSGEVRLAKPDPAIYRLALARFSLVGGRCLFIDDKVDNVHASREVGIPSVRFTGADDLLAHPVIAAALAR